MRRCLISLAAAGLSLAVVLVPVFAQSGTFLATFDGNPAAPARIGLTDWDFTIHTNDDSGRTMEAMQAGHGADCAAPPATHTISLLDDGIFQCRDHIMTAVSATYGEAVLTPARLMDFSAGSATLRFDASTLRSSTRDWIDIWVTPFADQVQLPADDWTPDLGGGPRRAVHIEMINSQNGSRFTAQVIDNGVAHDLPGISGAPEYESVLTPSAVRRDTFELDLSTTHVKFGMPGYDLWWVSTDMPDLGWSGGIVQLAQHAYNPEKGCTGSGACGANTWHWDTVSIEPSTPFTLLHPAERFLNAASPGVSFSGPAPADSHLRFQGIGNNLQVSFDGGQTWQPAQLQATTVGQKAEEHVKSYWTPIPSGVSSVQVRGGLWFGRPWYVRDLTIVSASAPAALPAPAVLPDAPAASPGDAVAPPDEPPNPPADDPS